MICFLFVLFWSQTHSAQDIWLCSEITPDRAWGTQGMRLTGILLFWLTMI